MVRYHISENFLVTLYHCNRCIAICSSNCAIFLPPHYLLAPACFLPRICSPCLFSMCFHPFGCLSYTCHSNNHCGAACIVISVLCLVRLMFCPSVFVGVGEGCCSATTTTSHCVFPPLFYVSVPCLVCLLFGLFLFAKDLCVCVCNCTCSAIAIVSVRNLHSHFLCHLFCFVCSLLISYFICCSCFAFVSSWLLCLQLQLLLQLQLQVFISQFPTISFIFLNLSFLFHTVRNACFLLPDCACLFVETNVFVVFSRHTSNLSRFPFRGQVLISRASLFRVHDRICWTSSMWAHMQTYVYLHTEE